MTRPRLLDLYCGGGGAGMGYHRAGFDVVGVDIRPQPRYPFAFVRADALDYVAEHGRAFDAIHASPPCLGYSVMRHATGVEHPRTIPDVRAALRSTGRPYVIENVERAKRELRDWALLCGTMLGLRVRRHRLFETSPVLPILTPPCACRDGVRDGRLIGQRLRGPKPPGRKVPPRFTEAAKRAAIGVGWMTILETQDAVPPAYTELIGRSLLDELAARVA